LIGPNRPPQLCTNLPINHQDTIDCSGSGDVDTSTVVEALPTTDTDADAAAAEAEADAVVIQGLSGRKLKLNPGWKNPTGKWRVGIKRAQELYPNGLKGRVKAERKKEWTIEVRFLLSSFLSCIGVRWL
jgi:tripeptidyl-peptidase II